MDSLTISTRKPKLVAARTAGEAERQARLEHARRVEREALSRLRERFRESDEHYQRAVRKLAEFDQLLAEVKSVLARYGYLGGARP